MSSGEEGVRFSKRLRKDKANGSGGSWCNTSQDGSPDSVLFIPLRGEPSARLARVKAVSRNLERVEAVDKIMQLAVDLYIGPHADPWPELLRTYHDPAPDEAYSDTEAADGATHEIRAHRARRRWPWKKLTSNLIAQQVLYDTCVEPPPGKVLPPEGWDGRPLNPRQRLAEHSAAGDTLKFSLLDVLTCPFRERHVLDEWTLIQLAQAFDGFRRGEPLPSVQGKSEAEVEELYEGVYTKGNF